ncbi:MAG: hypothetical protein PHV21_07750 [Synergistaceae bacterium]|jgi:hypothetical protein|nr:hypothetical protein [Synergistaceae bacterium]
MIVMHATGGTQTPIAALFLISVRSLFRYIFDFAQIAEENGAVFAVDGKIVSLFCAPEYTQ